MRPRPLRTMKWRKLMFVLPNLFTVSSIFCGFYAISLCTGDPTPRQLYQAALAVFFAMFFDVFDGRVARLTKTQSDFGTELDSLADVVSFGAAPALLVYKWALAPLGPLGLAVAFVFLTCGALRLARFNVLARSATHGSSSRFFVGLPIPLAGAMIAALVTAHFHSGAETVHGRVPVAVFVLVLSFLMVSNVRYRTFKDVGLSARSATVFAALLLAGVLVAALASPALVLVAYLGFYLVLGLSEEVLFFRRRRAEARASVPPALQAGAPAAAVAAVPAAAAPLASAPEDEEQEEDGEEEVEEEEFI